MTTEAVLGRLHPSLRQLIEAELGLGNAIVSAEESDWTVGRIWIVSLKKPFTQRYDDLPGIEFLSVNDPHYWGEDWSADGTDEKQIVTSPFVLPASEKSTDIDK